MTSFNANDQDHYFDVVTNVVGLVAAVLADKYYWWIDPTGAIILAVYTIVNWSKTVLENAGTFPAFLHCLLISGGLPDYELQKLLIVVECAYCCILFKQIQKMSWYFYFN